MAEFTDAQDLGRGLIRRGLPGRVVDQMPPAGSKNSSLESSLLTSHSGTKSQAGRLISRPSGVSRPLGTHTGLPCSSNSGVPSHKNNLTDHLTYLVCRTPFQPSIYMQIAGWPRFVN